MIESIARVPAWPLALPFFVLGIAVFGLEMARHLRVFAAVAPSRPLHALTRRTGALVRYALLQTRLFADPRAGVMHYLIFAGFVILGVGAANAVTYGLVQGVVGAPLDGALWAAVLLLQNVAAVGALAAVAYALVRRLISRPARLAYTTSAVVILLMIGGIVLSELGALTFEAAAYGALPGALITNALAVPLEGIDAAILQGLFALCWWLHLALIVGFLVILPRTKHLHIVTSFFNVFLRKLEPRGQLPMLDVEREDATFGLRTLADLGWKDLLDGFTCTECGRCQEACPAHATGKPLDPRAFIMGIRHLADEAETGLNYIPNGPDVRRLPGMDDGLTPTAVARPLVDGAISYDAVWDCVTCGACVQACPVLIEHVDKIVGIRRNLVLEDSRFPREIAPAFTAMERSGNPWGQPASTRLDWTKGLKFPVPVARDLAAAGTLSDVEVLYWVGCAAAFDDRARRTARAFATCLDAAGVRFAVLGQEESCSGDPARRMGNEYVFQMLATQNVETLRRYGPPTIVTACPHCFNTIANEYPQLGGAFAVVHHSAYLARLIADGRLVPAAAGTDRGEGGGADGRARRRTVTVHDSCYLARYNGVVAEPRAVVGAVAGIELREMDRHGNRTFCCGAGGGRMWMEEARGTRINAERTRQALQTGAQVVAVGCPFCMTMMTDGLAAAQGADGVVALDVAELLAEALVAG